MAFGSGGGRARPLGVGCIRMEGEGGCSRNPNENYPWTVHCEMVASALQELAFSGGGRRSRE